MLFFIRRQVIGNSHAYCILERAIRGAPVFHNILKGAKNASLSPSVCEIVITDDYSVPDVRCR